MGPQHPEPRDPRRKQRELLPQQQQQITRAPIPRQYTRRILRLERVERLVAKALREERAVGVDERFTNATLNVQSQRDERKEGREEGMKETY